MPNSEQQAWVCAAQKQGSAGGNDPVDCDWPVCGCDPYADKVIAALEEAGYIQVRASRETPILPAEGCDSAAAASSSEDLGINSSEVGR